MCIIFHREYFINKQFLIVKKIDIVSLIYSKVLESALLIANKLPNKVFWNLNSFNLELTQSIFNFVLRMQSINLVCTHLQKSCDLNILKASTDQLQTNVRTPWFVPKHLQILYALDVIDVIFDNQVEYSLIYVQSRCFSINS